MTDTLATAYAIAACHFFGDYVLQIDFIAKTKASNPWHMLAHCVLYTVPFAVVFGIDWRIWWVLLTHLAIDELKANGRIGYVLDQAGHLLAALPYMWG